MCDYRNKRVIHNYIILFRDRRRSVFNISSNDISAETYRLCSMSCDWFLPVNGFCIQVRNNSLLKITIFY